MRLSHLYPRWDTALFSETFIWPNIQRRSFLSVSETNQGISFKWRWTHSANFEWRMNSAKQRSVKSSNPALSSTKSILVAAFWSQSLSVCQTCWVWSTRILFFRSLICETSPASCCWVFTWTSPLDIDKSHLFPQRLNCLDKSFKKELLKVLGGTVTEKTKIIVSLW